ncbi:MAG: hypothetical protein WBK88_05175 [Methanothrix sp.]
MTTPRSMGFGRFGDDEDLLPAVERLAEAEEFHRWVEAGDDPIDGAVEAGRIEGERDRFI